MLLSIRRQYLFIGGGKCLEEGKKKKKKKQLPEKNLLMICDQESNVFIEGSL